MEVRQTEKDDWLVVGAGNIDLGCDALNNWEGCQIDEDRLQVVEFGSR